jgi:ATP-dependent RNA helicase SUPV3L1/SUV3
MLTRKIKRIIFETVRKYDGQTLRVLSGSQMKQIAGRAGRYGLDSSSSQGLVTTLLPNDLPILRSALASPNEPLRHAILGISAQTLSSIAQALPHGSKTDTMLEVPRYVAMLGNHFEFRDMSELDRITQFVDGRVGGRHHRELTLAEKQMLMTAPIPWRDPECMDIIKMFLGMYRMSLSVDVRKRQ